MPLLTQDDGDNYTDDNNDSGDALMVVSIDGALPISWHLSKSFT